MGIIFVLLFIVVAIVTLNLVLNLCKKLAPEGKAAKASSAKIVVSAVLLLYSISMILLFVWALNTSLKSQYDFRNNMIWLPNYSNESLYTEYFGPNKGLPIPFYANYLQVFDGFPLTLTLLNGTQKTFYVLDMYLNSILYSVGCAFMATFIPCIVSYIVARFNFKPLGIVYGIVIVCMIIPQVGTLPAQYRLADVLNLTNSFIGAWVMAGHFLGMYFLVFYASFKSVPKDYTEAAKIDGASNIMVMFRVIIPLVRNMFFTIFLLQFIAFWNNYQTPLLFLPDLPTISYGLFMFSQNVDTNKANDPTKIAGCMFVFIPIFIVYLIFHNRLMGNLSMGGLKE